ncbi:MAG TPA: hypothetical protein VFN10_13865 [Thermoanaerobaculia bacterium]|nr:hypothetical protein [Thermoanaerobaculia bacterium]
MSFVLRILFSGLVMFVPNQNGTEVDVLLLNAGQHSHLSDGSALGSHSSVMVARSGGCSGDCTPRESTVAQAMFNDKTLTQAQDSLDAAVDGGGAWMLSGSQLSVRKTNSSDPALPSLNIVTNARGTSNGNPLPIPTSSSEREDFSWVADLKQISPSTYTFNADLLDTIPPSLIAARFHLTSGRLYTYSVARMGSDVTPAQFSRLDGSGSSSSYSQAIASWVASDITVSASSVDLVEEKFNGGTGRSMTLTPNSNGIVEVAVLNLPSFVPPASTANNAPQVGKHFEMYYDVAESPISAATRLVPRAGAASSVGSYAQVSWSSIHPSTAVWSDLLNALRLDVGRGMYDRILCPPTQTTTP